MEKGELEGDFPQRRPENPPLVPPFSKGGDKKLSRGGGKKGSFRRTLGWVALLLALLLGLDATRAPERQWGARALIVGIDFYQATLSRWMPTMGVECRFVPTCSHYGEAVIRHHGAIVGGGKALWRIARCGPWTAEGTVEPPVPGSESAPGPSPEPRSSP